MTPEGPLRATPNSGAFELRSPTHAARTLVRVRLGIIGLFGVVVTGFVVCVSAANTGVLLPESVRPVPRFLAGPFGVGGPDLSVGVLIGLMTVMFGCYLLVMRAADRLSPRHVLMAIAALYALVLLAPPLLSTDVFSYQAYGRMWEIYGVNPYLNGPHVLLLDQLYPYIGAKWVNTPTSYGPLFTLLSVLLANLSHNANVAIAASALAYKAVATIACLGTIALLWKCARLRGLNPVRAVALFALNPLVVLYGVGGGHNDLLMLLFTTAAGIYALLLRRERSGGALIAFGAGIKLTAFLLLPFALASGVEKGASKRRRSILLGAAIVSAVIGVVGFVVFGTGEFNLISTLRTVQQEGDWHSIPGFLGEGLGLGGVSRITGIVLGLIFVVAFTWLLRRVWRNQMDWIDGAGWATFAMLLTAGSLLPWYVAWLMPLVGLCTDRRLWRYSLVLTAWILAITMIGYLPHGSTLLSAL